MCNSYHIESFVEPLLRSLDINESVRDSEYGKRRADVVVPSFDDVMNVVDVVTVDVCKKNALKNAQSEVSPLMTPNCTNGKNYQICPFAISLYGRLGKTALNFIDDFENLVKKRMNKRFDRRLWLNRIVFTIFKSIPKMISKALMSVSAHYEEIAVARLGLAKKKNPAFANLLQDMCDSTSSALVTTIPQVYGTLLTDSAWTLNMRFRSFIWPDNLPHNLICKCSFFFSLP
ncbi:hypothetical protein P9112_007185 [Eukaryota sp. TZLM1-RC]